MEPVFLKKPVIPKEPVIPSEARDPELDRPWPRSSTGSLGAVRLGMTGDREGGIAGIGIYTQSPVARRLKGSLGPAALGLTGGE
jgi:hypothetical protein